MAFVVTENCINCKHTTCVEVCPVDCFYEGPNFLVINPRECIDCGICARGCPTDAIIEGRNIKPDQQIFLRLNAELSVIWPNITDQKSPPPDVEEWEDVPDKLKLLERW